jgi:excisionase family DNA binding protein
MLDRRHGDRRRAIAVAPVPPPSLPSEPTAILERAERRGSFVAGEWLGVDQAACYLGLPSRKALYQAVRRGQVPVHRLGTRRVRFRRAELDHVLERGGQPAVLHSS